MLCVSLFGQLGEGWSAIHAGLTLSPMVAGIVIGMTLNRAGRALRAPPAARRDRPQQLSTSLGVAVLGTIFFSPFSLRPPTDALQVTAWACLVPLAGAFLEVFRLPMNPLAEPEG